MSKRTLTQNIHILLFGKQAVIPFMMRQKIEEKLAFKEALVFIVNQLTPDGIKPDNKEKIKLLVSDNKDSFLANTMDVNDIENLKQGSLQNNRRQIVLQIMKMTNPIDRSDKLNTVSRSVLVSFTQKEIDDLLQQLNDALKMAHNHKERYTLLLSISKLIDMKHQQTN